MTTLALSKRGNTQGATHPSEDLRKQAGITNGCQSNASVRDEPVSQPRTMAEGALARFLPATTEDVVCARVLCLG